MIIAVAGTGASARDSGDNSPATSARLSPPCSLAFDRKRDLYIVNSAATGFAW